MAETSVSAAELEEDLRWVKDLSVELQLTLRELRESPGVDEDLMEAAGWTLTQPRTDTPSSMPRGSLRETKLLASQPASVSAEPAETPAEEPLGWGITLAIALPMGVGLLSIAATLVRAASELLWSWL
jgi:hypothetical protein